MKAQFTIEQLNIFAKYTELQIQKADLCLTFNEKRNLYTEKEKQQFDSSLSIILTLMDVLADNIKHFKKSE